jgi:transcriptional regulator with XRE-family HTH domain
MPTIRGRFDLRRFARALDDRRHALRLRWIDVAEQTGVAQSILSRLATISRQDNEGDAFLPSLENALALATWLNAPLEEFWEVGDAR